MLDMPEASLERQLGSLLLQKGGQKLSLPLQGVDIHAKVVDRVAEVTIKQVFRNSHNEHLEAVYIFPMAAGSAVSNFTMHVGDRKIKGVVQERAEARQQYQQAVAAGKRAALLEQERDDVFTVQVGNLPPGEEITIEITYSERLPFFEDGKTELRLPLVVAPRYIPGTPVNREQVGDGVEFDTDQVPDASRITPPRLAKGVDPDTALKLQVEILPDEDGEINDMSCSQHATKAGLSRDGITVSLAKGNERLNRDFVLRWTTTGRNVKSTLMTYTGEDGETYGLLSILPPRRAGFLGAARDVVFILDRSGSMQGIKMTSAVRACNILLNTLGPQDRFAIAAFDNTVQWMPGARGTFFTNADLAGVEKGENFLRGVTANGGTELNHALAEAFAALSRRHDVEGRMPALVILTDGEVGHESAILQRIQQNIGDARLFAVGIDTAVNSGLLKRLANLGGGTATFVEPGIQLEEALASVAREIGAPVVTDLQLEDLDLKIDRASLSPSRIPDIFQGRASLAFLKLSGAAKGKIVVRGKYADGKPFEEKVKAQKVDVSAIAQLWAKAHIVDLEDNYRINNSQKALLKNQIVALAVKHQLLTKFTAFVVVDEAEIVNKTGDLHKVVQAVESPESWEMEAVSTALPAEKKLKQMAMMDVQASNRLRSLSKLSPAEGLGGDAYGAPPAAGSAPQRKDLAESIRQQIASTAEQLAREAAPKKEASSGWGDTAEVSARDQKSDSGEVAGGGWGAPLGGAASAGGGGPDDAWADSDAGSSNWGGLTDSANGQTGAYGQSSADQWGAPAAQSAQDSWGAPAEQSAQDSWGAPAPHVAGDSWSAPAPSAAPKEAAFDQLMEAEEIQAEQLQAQSFLEAQAPTPPLSQPLPQAPGPASQQPSPPPKAARAGSPPTEAAPMPAREEPGYGFSSQSGSYGMGVRAQVLEVIVRQAIAGAPWRQICAGSMQVNNITEEEVQAEVDRRLALLQKNNQAHPPAPPSQSGMGAILKKLEEFGQALTGKRDTAPTGHEHKHSREIETVRKLLTDFLSLFEQAFEEIANKKRPNESNLESARVKLLQALAPMNFGMECPELQRFLRSTAIELIGSLKDKSVTHEDLAEFWNSKQSVFESVKAELDTALNAKEASFWDSAV
jgi:Ca-activated chloride channel family protein